MPDQNAQARILFRVHIETELETLADNHETIIAQYTVQNDSTGRLAAAPHSPHTFIGVGTLRKWGWGLLHRSPIGAKEGEFQTEDGVITFTKR
jgi:hypothetical protein